MAPVRVLSQASCWSGGRVNSGIHDKELLRVHRHAGEEVFRILIDAAEPGQVGDVRHAGHLADARLVADRQRLDKRNLVPDDQAVGIRHFHARAEGFLDGAEEAEEHKGHEDGEQRQRRAQLLPLQIAPDEAEEFHSGAVVGELAFVQMDGAAGAGGGVGIVGDHDDGLALLLVEGLQQRQDFIAGLAVEIAGGFVAKQDGGVGDNGAGDADALLFAAGQGARVVLQRDGKGRPPSSAFSACWRRSAFGEMRQEQGQFHVPLRREDGHQIVELENEADVPRPPGGEIAAR